MIILIRSMFYLTRIVYADAHIYSIQQILIFLYAGYFFSSHAFFSTSSFSFEWVLFLYFIYVFSCPDSVLFVRLSFIGTSNGFQRREFLFSLGFVGYFSISLISYWLFSHHQLHSFCTRFLFDMRAIMM